MARPIRDQVLVAWASHQVRPDVTMYPMQPRSQAMHGYHPALLLLPVDREDYVGMFVTVWTPFTSFQGTFLFRTARFLTVQRLFDVLVQGNQCVWANECEVRIGAEVYAWGALVPVYSGINLELHETAPVQTGSQSTCSDPGASSSSEDHDWPAEGYQLSNHTAYHGEGFRNEASTFGVSLVQSRVELQRRQTRKCDVRQSGLEPYHNRPQSLHNEVEWVVEKLRPTFAQAAKKYLPPPGNGKSRDTRVAFSSTLEVNGEKCHDPCLGNPYMSHFKDTLKSLAGPKGRSNPFVQSLLKSEVARQVTQPPKQSLEPCWIHTPVGVFWCQDPVQFQRKLEPPFVLIPMQLFGLGHGFVVGDANREVLPVAFKCLTDDKACFVYLAYGTTADEIVRARLGPQDSEVIVADDFQVRSWGQTVEFVWASGSSPPVEHPTDMTGPAQGEATAPVILALHSLLWPSERRELAMDFPQHWQHKVHALWPRPLVGLPDGLKVHQATALALSQVQETRIHMQDCQCVVYVDGSAGVKGQAWGMVVTIVGSYAGNRCETFEGVCAAPQVYDPQASGWIGAHHKDNVDAELAAAFVAIAYALSLNIDVQVVVRPDLQYSCQLLDGLVAPRKDRPLTSLVANLGKLARQKGLAVAVRVEAHAGQAWNELADVVASYAVQHTALGKPDIAWLNEMATHQQYMEWWPVLHDNGRRFAFPAEVGGKWQIGVVPKATCAPLEQHQMAPVRVQQVSITCMTYNVLSLVDDSTFDQWGRRGGAKSARMDHQMHANGIHVAGFQEARTDEGVSFTEHYKIFSAGSAVPAAARQYGCEIWFHRTKSWTRDADISFQHSNVVVLHQDPRLLVVRLDNTLGCWVFLSGHAPYWGSADTHERVADWWKSLAKVCNQVPQHAKIIAFLDCNATLGVNPSELVGDWGAQKPGPATPHCEMLLHSAQLACPATFANIHQGPHGTWRHPSGAWKRIDHICVHKDLLAMAHKSYVWLSFDGGFTHDHVPVVLELKGLIAAGEHIPVRIDRRACADPYKVEQFQKALSALAIPSWSLDVDAHAAWHRQHVKELAEAIFVPEKIGSKPVWMSVDTRICIAWKRYLLDEFRRSQDVTWRGSLKEALKEAEKQVRDACRSDRRAFFSQAIADLNQAGLAHDFKEVSRMLTMLGKKRQKSGVSRILPKILWEDGRPAASFEEQQHIWFEQFAQIEAAVRVSDKQLQDSHQEVEGSSVALSVSQLPTFADVQRKLRKLRNGKATGSDGLPNEVLKAGGEPMARIMHELMVKVKCAGREPLQWKSGLAVPLYKKGAMTNPANYRSIFLSDSIAKISHSLLRDRLCETYERLAGISCFGGRPGRSTDHGHHMVQAMLAYAAQKQMPSAHVFLDLSSAFYHVLRQGLFGSTITDVSLCKFLEAAGIQPDELREWERQAAEDFALSTQTPDVIEFTKDAFRHSHFRVKGVSGAGHTQRGTRPGDPIGDVCFNIVMQVIMSKVRQQMVQMGYRDLLHFEDEQGEVLGSCPAFVDVSFFDDVAFSVVHSCCQTVVRVATDVLSILCAESRKRGMAVNLRPEKTEILLALKGPGSRKLKEKLLIGGAGKLPIVQEHSTEHVGLVSAYKHLGSYAQGDATPHRELQHRIASARKAWGPLLKNLWSNKNIAHGNKVMLFQSLVMSRMLYNAHVWSWYQESEIQKLQAAFRDMAKSIARPSLMGLGFYQVTVEDLAGLVGILDPARQLRVARLRYTARAVRYLPSFMWRILQETEGEFAWKTHLMADCEWLRRHHPSGVWPTANADFAQWLELIPQCADWRTRIKRAAAASLRASQRNAEHKLWELRMTEEWQDFGLTFGGTSKADPVMCFRCELCENVFASKRGLFMHSSHVHGYKPHVRFLAAGSCCLACGKEYHARQRLLGHLQYSGHCREKLAAVFPPLSLEEVAKLDEQDRDFAAQQKALGWHPRKALLPAIRIPHAALPPAGSEETLAIRTACGTDSVSTPLWHNVHGARIGADSHTLPAGAPADMNDTRYVYQQVRGSVAGEAGVFQEHSISVLDARIRIATVVFVHLYSGFRREGDLHHHIESHKWHAGVELFCISVDLCLQGDKGDLLSPTKVAWWKDRIRAGQVLGIGGGPPCETWSAARWLGGGPPPLRDRQAPWGLPWLSKKQHQQVVVGSGLLRTAVELAVMVTFYGGCFFIEHPQVPLWLEGTPCPAIWRTQMLKKLARLQCVSATCFDQCVFGACGIKPTTFLVGRMPVFREVVMVSGHGGRCHHGPGAHVGLAGRVNGRFRTAGAKIYPAGLNYIIAEAFAAFVASLKLKAHDGELSEAFSDLRQVGAAKGRNEIQPDYHY